MDCTAELDRLSEGLDRLLATLVGGSHESLREQASELASWEEVLKQWREPAREGRAAERAVALHGIRQKIALARELLEHAQQVNLAVAGILSMAMGSQYSPRGVPSWKTGPRLAAEG
jgi:hypothetical protein